MYQSYSLPLKFSYRCDGKTSCTLVASNGVFGVAACGNKRNWLKVWYRCKIFGGWNVNWYTLMNLTKISRINKIASECLRTYQVYYSWVGFQFWTITDPFPLAITFSFTVSLWSIFKNVNIVNTILVQQVLEDDLHRIVMDGVRVIIKFHFLIIQIAPCTSVSAWEWPLEP